MNWSLTSAGEKRECNILCGTSYFEKKLPAILAAYDKKLVFTDSNVYELYKDLIHGVCGDLICVMPAGEEYKTDSTLFALLKQMQEDGLLRSSCLVAIGGGVVGDIGGLAAALYMRGIACIQVPTTLLAQVDSSVGGKTAIDAFGVKNLIGAFRQADYVIVDSRFLKTLPPREIRCGVGEMVKHGALSSDLFYKMSTKKLTSLPALTSLIPDNIAFKLSVVQKDERETGLRKCLNLAHTTAHVIEMAAGTLSHGECVLIGILIEAEFAKRHCPCDPTYLDSLKALARRALEEIPPMPELEKAAELALLDKKNTKEGKVVLTVPTYRGRYALLELSFGVYQRELTQIGRALQ